MNKDIKMVRSLDSLGRLVIPIEIRREMGISTGDPVQMRISGQKVIVERYNDSCLMCGSIDNVFEIKNGKKLCKKCLNEIRQGDFTSNNKNNENNEE